jgi:riboflavin kinase/FMN adenylyltransferase
MQIFRSLKAIAEHSRPSTVTVGAFDGIHLAHQALLRRVKECAAQHGTVSAVVTFDPHPAAVIAPGRKLSLLTPLPIKLELISRIGMDRVLLLPFTEELSRWSPERFVREVLFEAVRARTVIVGENFRFGHKQAGTPEMLSRLGEAAAFQTEVIPSMCCRRRVVSSSQIRALLAEGNVALANRLLGYPFTIYGRIQRGFGIGGRQTVPTLNLAPGDGMLPREGVYITVARIGADASDVSHLDSEDPAEWRAGMMTRALRAVTNVGRSPTFGERALGVETHVIEPSDELSGGELSASLHLQFLARLRDERKFDSPEELKAQIARDVRRAASYFNRLRRVGIDTAW